GNKKGMRGFEPYVVPKSRCTCHLSGGGGACRRVGGEKPGWGANGGFADFGPFDKLALRAPAVRKLQRRRHGGRVHCIDRRRRLPDTVAMNVGQSLCLRPI